MESMQLFAIDIDGGLEYSEALKRAEKYCLPVALSYETLSPVNFSKYRLVFACNDKITDKALIQLMLICFCIIFYEAAKTGVVLNNNAFYVTEPYNTNDSCCYPEENNLKNIVIHDSLNNPYYLLFGENNANFRFATPPPKLKNVNFDDMECCQLMADFSSGVRLEHLVHIYVMMFLL